jgi:hypothetical protein
MQSVIAVWQVLEFEKVGASLLQLPECNIYCVHALECEFRMLGLKNMWKLLIVLLNYYGT